MLDFINVEQERLLTELEDINTSHQRRREIGETLAVIGDTRQGVGLREDGLPDIVWCPVPRGEITFLGNAGTFSVVPFYIAKYAITYMQFQAFLDDKEMGFDRDEWWLGLTPECQKQEMVEQTYKYDNHPRESVSWYQAVAFCRWLTARLPPDTWPSREISVGDGWIIRLPTEWEWQQAATGGRKDYEYPWGKEWDARRANTSGSGIARTTAVGMYPAGASPAPVGALDMSGNVWEWCLNEYENPKNVNITGDATRGNCGGSFSHVAILARALIRHRYYPRDPRYNLGFRVVVGAAPPSSGL